MNVARVLLQLAADTSTSARLGATRAQADFAAWRDQQNQDPAVEAQRVVIDFAGVEHTNTSYIKNGLYWLHACGRAFASGEAPRPQADPWHIRPLPIIPVVANLGNEVREAIDEVFYVRGAACLEMLAQEGEAIQRARLLGGLESKLMLSLQQLCRHGAEATAAELHAAFSANDDIGVTAWNNRLAELHAALLVVRRRQGKFWHYKPITKEIEDGRGPRT